MTARALVLAAALALAPLVAEATYRRGPLEAQARLSMQNAFHHDGIGEAAWVQERNELRFDVKYDLIRAGRESLGLRQASFNMVYRGRYDAIFDLRDHYGDLGYRRDDFRFPEGKTPRELFFDLRFAGALRNLSMRLGRQQVVWGEADLFRSLDVVNPLRLDQTWVLGDDFSEYREPLWIAKAFYTLGAVGPLADVGVETFYSPNGRPLTDRMVFGEVFRIKFDHPLVRKNRRPSQQPFRRVRYPWELSRVGPYRTEVFDQAELGDPIGNADLIYLTRSDVPTSTFSFAASMVGVRVLGKTFGGLDFTLNYLFKRSELPGTSVIYRDLFDPRIASDGGPNVRPEKLAEAGAAELTPDTDGDGIPEGRERLIRRCLEENEPVLIFDSLRGYPQNRATACLTQALWYPWTHILGATATYNDSEWTGMIFRAEQSVSTREPRNAMRPAAGPRAGQFPTGRDIATNGMRETAVWRSMVGFDWLRAFSWMPVTRHDPWFVTFQYLNEYYAHTEGQIGTTYSITDRLNRWNPLFTLLATGYFVNSRFHPTVAAGWDANVRFPFFWVEGEYHFGPRWSLRLGEILWAGSAHSESFLFLNKYADRDTLYVRLTYWLL